MLDYLRIKFLRYLSIIGVVALMLVVIVEQFANVPATHLLLNFSLFAVLLVASTLTYFPLSNVNPFYVLTGCALALYVGFTPYYIHTTGQMLPYGYLLYPVYTFLLIGARYGLIACSVLFVSILVNLGFNHFDFDLLGISGEAFLVAYIVEVILLATLERGHDFLLNEIEAKTYRDDLTGLMNRSGILREVEIALKKEKKFYFILTDFDHFSHINANLGHKLCDNIIREAAGIFKDHPKVHSIARWYGDQFGVLFLGDEMELNEYLKTRQRLIRTLADELKIEIEITYSCGITSHPDESITDNELIPYTEIALAEAKKGDRAVYHFFQSENLEDRHRVMKIEREILDAISREEIEVHFQPKVSVRTEKVSGMEALVRWFHPELGYIAPPEFVAIAERTGDIVPLGEYVMCKALEHLKKCQATGATELSVSINISPLHLLHTRFILFLNETVLRYGINPEHVYLEITENVMLQTDLVKHLDMIKRLGFKLSLDDFGTGYSSLNYLNRFSFDELKIDKSFTDGITRSEKERILFRTILEIARNFRMSCVIEGLEEASQLEIVRELGADEIQGWYYSKALPSDMFLEFLKEKGADTDYQQSSFLEELS